MITQLKENEVFVFGSNLLGAHLGGGAKQAMEEFGAQNGVGEGMTGKCYAFPTLDHQLQKRSTEELKESRDKFYMTCRHYSALTFQLTAVGTGIAGYSIREMKQLFKNAPKNVVLPKEFI